MAKKRPVTQVNLAKLTIFPRNSFLEWFQVRVGHKRSLHAILEKVKQQLLCSEGQYSSLCMCWPCSASSPCRHRAVSEPAAPPAPARSSSVSLNPGISSLPGPDTRAAPGQRTPALPGGHPHCQDQRGQESDIRSILFLWVLICPRGF